MMNDEISPLASTVTARDSRIAKKILKLEGTGRAIVEFDKYRNQLSNYTYWFMLSTLWVSYAGHSDLRMWRRLFSSDRANRAPSIMKPYELAALEALPNALTVYRAKRQGETDCIAYTLDKHLAASWAVTRNVDVIHQYRVPKENVLALFLRRSEQEVIVLEPSALVPVGTINIEAI